jgi:hypothetical protein
VVQQADFANPPTLLLALQSLLIRARPADASGQRAGDAALSDAEAATVRAFLRHVRPRLQVPVLSAASFSTHPNARRVGLTSVCVDRTQRWTDWYHRTQAGVVPGLFRWRGRQGHDQSELNPKVRRKECTYGTRT